MAIEPDAVRGFACFASSADWEAAVVARLLTEGTHTAGETVMRQGEPGDTLYLLVEGEAEILAEAGACTSRLATVGAGGVFGEIGLLLDVPRSATVRALTPLRVWRLSRSAFDQAILRGDSWGIKLLLTIAKVLATRLAEVDHRLIGVLCAGSRASSQHADLEELRRRLFADWNY